MHPAFASDRVTLHQVVRHVLANIEITKTTGMLYISIPAVLFAGTPGELFIKVRTLEYAGTGS